MLKTYSIKGNTCIIPFVVKTNVSNYTFTAEFTGGDAFGLSGKTKRATYRTDDQMKQFAIESCEMFTKGIIKLVSAIETEAEVRAKARLAAQMAQDEEEAVADVEHAPKKVATKKK